jgi:eukaryotic-like serine/threonine-protein kinase
MPTADPRIGSELGERYRILERLGEGGMGVVYRAERIGIARPVAVKFLHANIADQKEFVGRFEREARAMSRLTHPNCVPVIDYGVEDAPYIVMDLVSGRNLADLASQGPLPPGRAIAIVRQVLAGLAHAHENGIVHRDMKPANVVLEEIVGSGEQARILDFGLAKILEGSSEASWSTLSVAVGTPSYMAPEQARAEPVDFRCDLYSVGVMLFELLTGRKPFVSDGGPAQVLALHKTQPPPSLGDGFSPALDRVVRRALAKQPAERYAGALWMSRALAETAEASGSGPPIEIVATSAPRADAVAQVRRAPVAAGSARAGRRSLRWAILGVVLAAALAAAALGTVRLVRSSGRTDAPRGAPGSAAATRR